MTGTAAPRYHPTVRPVEDVALVLDARPFRERHLLLAVLAPAHGVVRGILRNARGRRTARRAAAAQLLSRVRARWHQRPAADLATFEELEIERSSFPLAREVERAAAAAVVAEALLAFCPEGEAAPRHFGLGTGLLEALLGEAPPRAAIAYALYWVLRLGGVLPEPWRCTACGAAVDAEARIAPGDAHPRCAACAPPGSRRLGPAAIRWLAAARRTPPAELAGDPPREALEWLERLVRIEAHRPLPALDVWHRLSRP